MEDNQTSEDKAYDPKAPRKKVLTPLGKPEAKEGEHITPRGKDIKVGFDKQYGLYKIIFPDGGALPEELQGRFTEEKRAHGAVKAYLLTYWKNRT